MDWLFTEAGLYRTVVNPAFHPAVCFHFAVFLFLYPLPHLSLDGNPTTAIPNY